MLMVGGVESSVIYSVFTDFVRLDFYLVFAHNNDKCIWLS